MIKTKIKIHQKFEPLYQPKRYKVYHGGRNGMKTFSFSEALVIKSSRKFMRIICGRQFMESIDISVKPAIEKQIIRLGMEDEFNITERQIINKVTGSIFRFKGLARNILSIKGWEDVDVFWGEEAHSISLEAWELLTKTIRQPGSEIWLSFNRHSRNDVVDKRFLSKDADTSDVVIIKVGWQDNPHLSKEQENERLYDLKYNSERYPHIWNGEPDDEYGGHKVLKYADLVRCVDAHKILKYTPSGSNYSGLDIADEGNDTNAWSKRQASLLSVVKEWKVKYLHMTATKADMLNAEHNVLNMHYDAGGMGAGIKSDLSRIKSNPQTGTGPGVKKFIPFLFNGKVKGPKKYYIRHKDLKITNKDFFHRINAQAWWNLKLRLRNTIKALDGEKVDLDKCFFISSEIDDYEKVLAELNQCVYDDSSGKIKIDKAPDGALSPNCADSIIMAYANDIKKGLKAG